MSDTKVVDGKTLIRYEVQIHQEINKVYEVYAEHEDDIEDMIPSTGNIPSSFKELEIDDVMTEVSVNYPEGQKYHSRYKEIHGE